MAAIDMAAWDALARAAGLALVRLLGGEPRPIPVYNSLGMGGVDLAAHEAEESASAGFRGVKYKIGYPDVQTDLDVVRAAQNEPAAMIWLFWSTTTSRSTYRKR